MSKIQVEVGVGAACVVVVGACTVEVAVQLAHERLLTQGCWGTVQMEVVTVDTHELPVEVWIGSVVGGPVVIVVSVGRFVETVVVAAAVVAAASRSVSDQESALGSFFFIRWSVP
jgi:hypothetical protein